MGARDRGIMARCIQCLKETVLPLGQLHIPGADPRYHEPPVFRKPSLPIHVPVLHPCIVPRENCLLGERSRAKSSKKQAQTDIYFITKHANGNAKKLRPVPAERTALGVEEDEKCPKGVDGETIHPKPTCMSWRRFASGSLSKPMSFMQSQRNACHNRNRVREDRKIVQC